MMGRVNGGGLDERDEFFARADGLSDRADGLASRPATADEIRRAAEKNDTRLPPEPDDAAPAAAPPPENKHGKKRR